MANTTSAVKAIKQIKKRTTINRVRLGKYKSAIKTIEEAIVSKDKTKH